MKTVIANNIKYLRKNKGLSQEAFAALVGANRGNIDTYERGIAKPKEEIAKNICNQFDITLDDLYKKDLSKSVKDNNSGNNLMMPEDFDALERVMIRWRHHLDTPHPTDRIYKTIATDSPIIALANLMRRVDEIEDRLRKDDDE